MGGPLCNARKYRNMGVSKGGFGGAGAAVTQLGDPVIDNSGAGAEADVRGYSEPRYR